MMIDYKSLPAGSIIFFEDYDEFKQFAKQILSDTDWVMQSDVPVTNKEAFREYRAIVRNMLIEKPDMPINLRKPPEHDWIVTEFEEDHEVFNKDPLSVLG